MLSLGRESLRRSTTGTQTIPHWGFPRALKRILGRGGLPGPVVHRFAYAFCIWWVVAFCSELSLSVAPPFGRSMQRFIASRNELSQIPCHAPFPHLWWTPPSASF